MKSFPNPLTPSEEKYYIRKYTEGDLEAKHILIERNLRLVAHVIKKYQNSEEDPEDLISIGTIGLIKAINTFNPTKNIKLATYASRCIENEILMYFRGQRKSASDVSLSECIETGRDGNALSLMDVICSEEDLFEQLSEKEIYGRLHAAVNTCLTPREQRIILLRYGLGNRKPLTQREIAVQCGISRSYVSRIEKRALQKLEDALTKET